MNQSKKLKILMVTPFFSPSMGGVENYVLNISKTLQNKYNCQVAVITANINSRNFVKDTVDGLTVYRLPTLFNISNTPINPFWYFYLRRIIKNENPDIINSHQPVPFLGDLTALASKDTPFILTYHAGTMIKDKFIPDLIIKFYQKYILPKTVKKASYLICASNFVKTSMFKEYNLKKQVIYPGIDEKLFINNNSVVKDDNTVLFIGRHKNMYTLKGLYYLIDAVKSLPNVNLKIIGDKDISDNKRIKYIGILEKCQVIKEIQQASILVLCSLADHEAFGTVLIEAMACKTPVIGTIAGGIPEIINNGVDGLIVPPSDSKALSIAIDKILKDKMLALKMGEKGQNKVYLNYTWDSRTNLTYSIYQSCLKQSK